MEYLLGVVLVCGFIYKTLDKAINNKKTKDIIKKENVQQTVEVLSEAFGLKTDDNKKEINSTIFTKTEHSSCLNKNIAQPKTPQPDSDVEDDYKTPSISINGKKEEVFVPIKEDIIRYDKTTGVCFLKNGEIKLNNSVFENNNLILRGHVITLPSKTIKDPIRKLKVIDLSKPKTLEMKIKEYKDVYKENLIEIIVDYKNCFTVGHFNKQVPMVVLITEIDKYNFKDIRDINSYVQTNGYKVDYFGNNKCQTTFSCIGEDKQLYSKVYVRLKDINEQFR